MYLSGSNKIAKSMNGLLKIDAGEINADIANIGIINSVAEINGKTDQNLIFDVDVGRIIEFKDSVVMDQSLNVTGALNVTGTSNLTGVVASGNVSASSLTVSGTSNLNSVSASGNVSASSLSVLNTSTFTGNIIANNVSTFNSNVFANLNLHTKTFDVSNNSIFNGSITAKGITSNGVCTFNNPVVTNSSLVGNGNIHGFSLDISNNCILNGPVSAISTVDISGNLTVNKIDVDGVSTFNVVSIHNSDVFCNALVDISGNLTVKKMTASDVATHNADVVNNFNTHSNTLDISNNSIFNTSTHSGIATFNNTVDVSQNLNVGKNGNGSAVIDLTGQILIRDETNPSTIRMKIEYEPSLFGFAFTDETPGRIMNFRVRTGDNLGYKLFYFSQEQVYANMGIYADAWLNVRYNKQLTLGDNNGAVWFGAAMQYVPNNAVTSGLNFYNKGVNNNEGWYTNFSHNNLSNNETPTFRMNYANIFSLVPHKMSSTLDVSGNTVIDGSLNVGSNLTVAGNLTLSGAGKTIKYPDNTTQATAYTAANNTKLSNIGTIYTATLVATTMLQTNTFYSLGNIALDAGSYLYTINVELKTVGTAGTSISQLSAAYSTNATTFSQERNMALFHGNGISTFPVGARISLNTTGYLAVGTSGTLYYLNLRVTYGQISRLQFMNDGLYSQFRFMRVG